MSVSQDDLKRFQRLQVVIIVLFSYQFVYGLKKLVTLNVQNNSML